MPNITQLELGGGLRPHPGSQLVIDLHHPRMSPAQDAAVTPWQTDVGDVPTGSVHRVFSSHFLEHIPAGQARIDVLNEAHRVLVHGGRFDAVVPTIGYTDQVSGRAMSDQVGWQPWADPTHVSYWWMPESVLYFCEGPFKPLADYGINVWRPLGPECPDPFTNPLGGWRMIDGWLTEFSIIRP
jgi:hypothetical protein